MTIFNSTQVRLKVWFLGVASIGNISILLRLERCQCSKIGQMGSRVIMDSNLPLKFVVALYFADAGFIAFVPSITAGLLGDLVFSLLFPVPNSLQALPVRNRNAYFITGRFNAQKTRLPVRQLDHTRGRIAVSVPNVGTDGSKNNGVIRR